MKFAIVADEQTPVRDNQQRGLEHARTRQEQKTHVKSVLRKLGAANRTHAVAVAQRRGILPRESTAAPRHVSLAGIGNGKPPSPSALRHF